MPDVSTSPRRRGRPPKAAGDYRETRELLCRAGVAALTEKGYSATGIDEILKSVGVPKGSFYHYFDSKQAFGAELISAYDRYFARKLDRFLTDEDLAPLERIDAFCRDAAQGMARHDFRRGCLIGNLGQEMSALPEAFRSQLQEVLRGWQARVARCLEAARDAGDMPHDTDCERLAVAFWIGWEGAVLHAKLERCDEPLRMFAELFRAALRAPRHSV